jgi:hypothetical protein
MMYHDGASRAALHDDVVRLVRQCVPADSAAQREPG